MWEHRTFWPIERLYRILQVSTHGYRTWVARRVRQSQRTDLKVLAHICEQYALSNQTYGTPRMTAELKEAGLNVGERRVGQLMKLNGIRPVRTRWHKVTTDSRHTLGFAANILDGDFLAEAVNRKWVAI